MPGFFLPLDGMKSYYAAFRLDFDAMTTKSSLMEFLNQDKNMHARESILMHRLFLDLQTAAARNGYYLNTYFDDVDHDGFDVILDDQDSLKKVQVKTLGKGNTTGTWKIHRRLLRPALSDAESLGFEASPTGVGTAGGVVLMEFDDDGNELSVEYLYCDVYVLLALELGLFERRHATQARAVSDVLKDWRNDESKFINVPKAAFWRTKSPASLLALMGLHSLESFAWCGMVHKLVNLNRLTDEQASETLDCPLADYRAHARSAFMSLLAEIE